MTKTPTMKEQIKELKDQLETKTQEFEALGKSTQSAVATNELMVLELNVQHLLIKALYDVSHHRQNGVAALNDCLEAISIASAALVRLKKAWYNEKP